VTQAKKKKVIVNSQRAKISLAVKGKTGQIKAAPSFASPEAQAEDIGFQNYNSLFPSYLSSKYNTKIKMEVLLGITGKDFTIIAASKAAMRGATILKASDDKTRELNKHNLMAFSGEAGDTGMCFSD